MTRPLVAGGIVIAFTVIVPAQIPSGSHDAPFRTIKIAFESGDGTPLSGTLTTPESTGPHPVVVYVQTAEAQTMDTRIQRPRGRVVEFFDLYRARLADANIAFFSYEGRGVMSGSSPPRYMDIDRAVYNTSTLENKVRDAVAAVQAVKQQPGIDGARIFLTGVSEGTLLAAETAARLPQDVKGIVLSSVLTDLREALTFMTSDGAYLQHRGHWDANNDGVIAREEFDADPKGVRRVMPNVGFDVFDLDRDGAYTIEERRRASKPLTDAIAQGNLEIVGAWLKTSAVIQTPDGWLADHFAHPSIWTFLSRLNIPVGIFHGEVDANTPVAGVRALERLARAAGRNNIEFHYFRELDHSLGGLMYFDTGVPSEGYQSLFEWVRRHAGQ